MNILIDINHPAHVHLIKNLYFDLSKKNHHLFVSVKKNLFSAIKLLENNKIPHILIGKKSDNLFSKAINQIKYDFEIIRLVYKKKIDLGFGTSINIAHASKFSNMKSVILDDDDDDVQPLFTKYAHPFCDSLLSPESLKGKRGKKDTIYYSGFHELAYLHPKRFTPDVKIINEIGLKTNEKYFILRFNSFKAHHDIGVKGLKQNIKLKLIELLKPYGRIFITTEREIDPQFKKYQLNIKPDQIHSLIYYATLLIGDSQTMTSEAAVLGTPSIRSNSFVGKISYLEEEEHKYGLTFGFLPSETEKMFEKINEILNNRYLKQEWSIKKDKMLLDKIDVTAFWVWFLENYPESVKIMKANPDYQYNFR